MILFLLACLISSALSATIVDPTTCTIFPCLIFNDDFDTFDHDAWEHEITMTGGGNWEFQVYVNNRTTTYVRDGILYIKPWLTSDWKTEALVTTGTINLYNINGRNDDCSSNMNFGCERTAQATGDIVNPIMSGRLRSLNDFYFRYGSIEVRAKMPRGDWLWPAIWMLPHNYPYGGWPASGEIDIVESRGNDDFGSINNTVAGSTMHWGPYFEENRYSLTAEEYSSTDGVALPDGFHTWKVDWTSESISFYLDDVLTLTVDPGTNFFDFGGLASVGDIKNPWEAGDKMAPFDQPFFLIMNVAVGGTNGFFPDGVNANKPWSNTSPTALRDFWAAKDTNWLPTWTQGGAEISENAAMQIDYVRVYKQDATQI